MWSFRERLDLKPTCASLSLESVASVYLVNIKLQKRLPTIQSIVIPRQLLQSEMSSFFGSVIITTFVSSSVGHSFFQALCDKIRICCVFGGQASRLKFHLDQLLYPFFSVRMACFNSESENPSQATFNGVFVFPSKIRLAFSSTVR